MNGSLHDPLRPNGVAVVENGGGEITIGSEARRLTLLKDGITARLDTYYDVLRTVRPPLLSFPRKD